MHSGWRIKVRTDLRKERSLRRCLEPKPLLDGVLLLLALHAEDTIFVILVDQVLVDNIRLGQRDTCLKRCISPA